jgi:transcription elongation factor Elf1
LDFLIRACFGFRASDFEFGDGRGGLKTWLPHLFSNGLAAYCIPYPPVCTSRGILVAIQVNCPSCGKLLRLPDDVAGKQLHCPSCQNQFKMEAQNGTAESSRRPQPREAFQAKSRPNRPSSRAEDLDEKDRPSRRSSRYDDDDDFDDRPVRRRSSRRNEDRGFACPFCGSSEPPLNRSKISTAGWVVFALLLLLFWPLFWIGLLIKENFRVCAECGKTLS